MTKEVKEEVTKVILQRKNLAAKSHIGQFSALAEEFDTYEGGPASIAPPKLQGCWAPKKFSPEKVVLAKPVVLAELVFSKPVVQPKVVSSKSTDPKVVKLLAKLADLREDLENETQSGSGSWADSAEVEDIEDEIEEIEEQLSKLL
jgi:hypothetical protein